MGSIGEDELDQMVKDYIESAGSSSSSFSVSSSKHSLHQSTYLSLQEVLGKRTDDEVEICAKISMYLDKNTGESPRNQKKWLVMKLRMDGYDASLCKSTWDSTCSFSQGNYEYVEVLMRDKKLNGGVPTRLIVDMDFRSQFEVARPTRAYKELIDALPSIFVGTEKKLKEIVSLLCPACRKSLKETGLHIPPWRSASYMQSKWLSTNCKKVTFSPNNELGVDQSEEKSTSTCCPFIF
ncbi:hypothetical protein AB3S75_011544 [Citrus x aurantiifolia]